MSGRLIDLGCSFGVMQGRLSRQTTRGYQCFPWEAWAEEFPQAARRGLEHIEWVLDSWHIESNPLLSDVDSVLDSIQDSGVQVISVCADYLMDRPLNVDDTESWRVFIQLLNGMNAIGAKWIVVPCVDQSSLLEASSQIRFLRAMERVARLLEGTPIRVAIESDLGPSEYSDLLADLDPERFSVNYDSGNSASLGYVPSDEWSAYGERISVIHIKDRTLRGGPVPLGQGNADIPSLFRFARDLDFSGVVTMQAYRDIQGRGVLDEQIKWLVGATSEAS